MLGLTILNPSSPSRAAVLPSDDDNDNDNDNGNDNGNDPANENENEIPAPEDVETLSFAASAAPRVFPFVAVGFAVILSLFTSAFSW